MPSLTGQAQQQGGGIVASIVTERIDIAGFAVGPTTAAELGSDSENENGSHGAETQNDRQDSQASLSQATTATKSRKKRNTFSYRLKHFKAKSDLFLNETYKSAYLDKYPDNDLELVGQIVKVANVHTKNMYMIDWKTDGTLIEDSWTITKLKKDDTLRKRLQDLIIEYEQEKALLSETPLTNTKTPAAGATTAATNSTAPSSDGPTQMRSVQGGSQH